MKGYVSSRVPVRNRSLLMVAGVLVVYLLICLTPAHRGTIRLFPDAARFFHPPFFFYNEDYSSGGIGPFRIGQSPEEVGRTANAKYEASVAYEACSPYPQTRARLFGKNEQCMLLPSRFGMAPTFWIFHFASNRLAWVRVRTEVPMEF